MKAIETKYLGPTNTKGTRISVKAEGLKSKQYSWDYRLGVYDNYLQAATNYANELGWINDSVLVGGSTPNGYTFVMVGKGWAAE